MSILRCPTAFSEHYLLSNVPDPDIFYIDADHSSAAVAQDIGVAIRVTQTGLICGDDWGWPSVQRGVVRSTRRLGMRIFIAPDGITWVLGDKRSRPLTNRLLRKGWKKRSKIKILAFLAYHRSGQILRGTKRAHT